MQGNEFNDEILNFLTLSLIHQLINSYLLKQLRQQQ
jgi:hypothetical protein